MHQRYLCAEAAGSVRQRRSGCAKVEILLVQLPGGSSGIGQSELVDISCNEVDVAAATKLRDPGGVAGDRDVEHHAGNRLDEFTGPRNIARQLQSDVQGLISPALF